MDFYGESSWTFKLNVKFCMWVDETQIVCSMVKFWPEIVIHNMWMDSKKAELCDPALFHHRFVSASKKFMRFFESQ